MTELEDVAAQERIDITPSGCVMRGVAWLDTAAPGWATRITEPLRLIAYDGCVIGQVFKDDMPLSERQPWRIFWNRMRELAINATMSEMRLATAIRESEYYDDTNGQLMAIGAVYGFALTHPNDDPRAREEALADEWHKVITARCGS